MSIYWWLYPWAKQPKEYRLIPVPWASTLSRSAEGTAANLGCSSAVRSGIKGVPCLDNC